MQMNASNKKGTFVDEANVEYDTAVHLCTVSHTSTAIPFPDIPQ